MKSNRSVSFSRWIFWLKQPVGRGYFHGKAAVAPVPAPDAERQVSRDEFHLAMRNLAVEAAKAMEALCQAVDNRKIILPDIFYLGVEFDAEGIAALARAVEGKLAVMRQFYDSAPADFRNRPIDFYFRKERRLAAKPKEPKIPETRDKPLPS